MSLQVDQVKLSLSRARIERLLSNYLARADERPEVGSVSLWIGGQACGVIPSAVANCLRLDSVVKFECQKVSIGDPSLEGLALDQVLAEIAQTIRSAGFAPGWRNELLDVWSHQEESIAGIERGVVRPLGLLTKAVHLNGLSADGGIWVARRALTKATDPGLWDTLVGGLVGQKEDPDIALSREAEEEAGLDASDIAQRTPLRKITRMLRRVKEGFQCEEVLTSQCVLEPGVTPKNRDGEVMEIACVTPDRLLRMLEEEAFTLEASIVLADDLLRRSIA